MRDDDKPIDPELEAYVLMLLSGVRSVADEPECEISFWRIISVNVPAIGERTHHVNGTEFGMEGGRISSPIVRFEPELRSVFTRSGRQYILKGGPANDMRVRDRESACDTWMRRNGLAYDDFEDVTPAYADRLKEHKPL